MKSKITDILVVLDRSGSMASITKDVIGGFNTFIEKQKKEKGKAFLTLTQFDHEYEVVYDRVAIGDVKALDSKTYIPRGSTALNDAIGRATKTMLESIEKRAKKDKPDNVLCLIVTDGQENASKEYTKDMIVKLIKEQEAGNWVFSFIGTADANAFAAGMSYGIMASNIAAVEKTSGGILATFEASALLSTNVRAMGHNHRKSEEAESVQSYYDHSHQGS